jgi:hypothetical protein
MEALLAFSANDRDGLEFSRRQYPRRKKNSLALEGPAVWYPVAAKWYSCIGGSVTGSSFCCYGNGRISQGLGKKRESRRG